VDVHVFTEQASGKQGDAFFADAISIAEASGGAVSIEC